MNCHISANRCIATIPSESKEVTPLKWSDVVSKSGPPNERPSVLPSLHVPLKKVEKKEEQLPKSEPKPALKPPTLHELVKGRPKVVILLRGLPGCGKTTFANALKKQYISSSEDGTPGPEICSADYFFEHDDGSYLYDRRQVASAHKWAQSELEAMMEDIVSPIIIDNCNVMCWEARGYVELAIDHEYAIEIVDVRSPWSRNVPELAKKCVQNGHNVAEDVIRGIFKKWESDFTVDNILAAEKPKPKTRNPNYRDDGKGQR